MGIPCFDGETIKLIFGFVMEYICYPEKTADKLLKEKVMLLEKKTDLQKLVMLREERERKQRCEAVKGFFRRVDSLDDKVTDFQQKLSEISPTVGCLQKCEDRLKSFKLKMEATDLLDEVKELLAQHDDLKSSDRLLNDIVEQHALKVIPNLNPPTKTINPIQNSVDSSQEGQRPTRRVKGVYWCYTNSMLVSDIDSTLFTHIFYYSADLDPNSGALILSSPHTAATFTSTLLQKNPSVKTILTIGNKESMEGNASSRKAFIESSILIARLNGFSGLDLDWSSPNGPEQMANFGTLLDEWHVAVVTEATATGMTKLLLTATLNDRSSYNSVDYPIDSIKRSLDWVNVYTYDYYNSNWHPSSTRTPAPLHDPNNTYNISFGIDSWIRMGLPRDKIVLGISFFGRAWTLVNPTEEFGIGAKAKEYKSLFGKGSGAIAYKDINTFMKDNKIKTVYDSTTVTNYCYAGTTWIGYDDVEAMDGKILYAKCEGLLGYILWDIEADDDNLILSNRASSTWDSAILPIFIEATELKIKKGNDEYHWKWIVDKPSRSSAVAKLVHMSPLEVIGEIQKSKLALGENYTVYLRYKMAERHFGLEYPYIVSRISIDDAKASERKVYLVPTQASTSGETLMPHLRDDGWHELSLGDISNEGDDGKVSAALTSLEKKSMGGLIVDGMEFRVKE